MPIKAGLRMGLLGNNLFVKKKDFFSKEFTGKLFDWFTSQISLKFRMKWALIGQKYSADLRDIAIMSS